MNVNRKIVTLIFAVLFVMALSLGAVSAAKTVKVDGWVVKLTKKDIKKIKKGEYVVKSTHCKLTDFYRGDDGLSRVTGTVKIGFQKRKEKIMAYVFNDYPGRAMYKDMAKKRVKL